MTDLVKHLKHFEQAARKLHEIRGLKTIIVMCEAEHREIEAAYLKLYGKQISLRGKTPEQIKAQLK